MRHTEKHRTQRIGRLRAVVLGANDELFPLPGLAWALLQRGLIHKSTWSQLLASAAGAMSMAAGEYVSVSSQADTERADQLLQTLHYQKTHENQEVGLYRGRQDGFSQSIYQNRSQNI